MEPRKSRGLNRLTAANLALLVLVWIATVFVAEATAFTTFLAYSPQLAYLGPTGLLLIACLRAKERKLALLNLGVAAGFGWLLLGVNLPRPRPVATGQELRVLTYNLHHAKKGWAPVREIIEKHRPDVFCLQEADSEQDGGSVVEPIPGYQVVQRGELCVGSRHPIESVRSVSLASGIRPALEVKTAGVTVVNVHLTSFIVRKVLVSNPFALPDHFSQVGREHSREIDGLVREYGSRSPIVVCGDFNHPPRGRIYNTLVRSFDDAFAATGVGTGFTYPAVFPMTRIDHVMVKGLKPLGCGPIWSRASDHRPVFGRFEKPQ
jgi:vancomycin resistance protein VanJ